VYFVVTKQIRQVKFLKSALKNGTISCNLQLRETLLDVDCFVEAGTSQSIIPVRLQNILNLTQFQNLLFNYYFNISKFV
jgi:hypothetical protein